MDGGCAGIDWAKDGHAVCVLGGVGVGIEQRCFVHDERGLDELCQTLRRHGVGRVAIERPEGVLVERLLEAGLAVMAVHPNQLKAARPRFQASGGKSDAFDASCLAELARTDHHRFRVPVPGSDETKAIRVLTRAREDLVSERVAVTNRLRAELDAFWPAPTGLFRDLDSPISLAFLERYPSPQDARSLGEKRFAAFLAKNGYRGRKKRAGELIERLRSAPPSGARVKPRPRHAGRWCSRWWAPCVPSWRASRDSQRGSPKPRAPTPTGRPSSLCSAAPDRR